MPDQADRLSRHTARPGLVCVADLCGALDAGRIARAGLDVFEVEPIQAANPEVKPRLRW